MEGPMSLTCLHLRFLRLFEQLSWKIIIKESHHTF